MKLQAPLTVAALLVSVVAAQAADPQFPAQGMPYSQAKAMLLKQGLFIGPEKVVHPNSRFPEIDCLGEGGQRTCRAAFVQKQTNGWGQYVVVDVDPATLEVRSADFATTADGLPAVPPPLAPDVPPLKGAYIPAARDRLRQLGFKPIPSAGNPAIICRDLDCKQKIQLPESFCSGTGMSFCDHFWLSPKGRVLKVTTIGEFTPQVYFIQWSTRKEQHDTTMIFR